MKTWIDDTLIVVVVICLLLQFQGGGGVIPDITPNPPPIDAPGLNVMVVYETESHSAGVVDSTLWHQYVLERGGDYETFDADADHTTPAAKWREPLAKAKAGPLPVVVVSNGRTGEVAPLPTTPEAMIELIKKYADG